MGLGAGQKGELIGLSSVPLIAARRRWLGKKTDEVLVCVVLVE